MNFIVGLSLYVLAIFYIWLFIHGATRGDDRWD